jgi:hypothetical protein
MITKITLTVDVNPETLECKIIKQENAKSESTRKVEPLGGTEPKIVLEDNKYMLNEVAASLMGVSPEDRLAIRYKKIDKVLFPVIGKQEAFNIKSGNRVTKGLTVSCRGAGNEELAKYGSVFTVTPMKGSSDLFVLIGDTDAPNQEDSEIDTTQEEEAPEEDLTLENDTIDNNDSFEISDDSFNL